MSCSLIEVLLFVHQPSISHYDEKVNMLKNVSGSGAKTAFNSSDLQGQGTWFSQYNRVHNKLGIALGPGIARERLIRRTCNPLTGSSCYSRRNIDNFIFTHSCMFSQESTQVQRGKRRTKGLPEIEFFLTNLDAIPCLLPLWDRKTSFLGGINKV